MIAIPIQIVPESVAQAVALAGALVLVLMIVALVGFAYKSLQGDGITWPEDDAGDEDDDVRKGSEDDEWEFY